MATSTPWGSSQSRTKIAPGINFYMTAGHGGFKVHKAKNQLIPEKWRHSEGWYEEDCGWVPLVITFPEYFPTLKRPNDKQIKSWECWIQETDRGNPPTEFIG